MPYAGGRALKTPFGVFYSPNITPDLETGIGGWSDRQFLDALKRPDIHWDDYLQLRTGLNKAERVGASLQGRAVVKFRDLRLADVNVNGVTANYADLMNLDIATGRFFLESEARTGQHVAVIGWDVKDELYPQLDPVGREVLIDGVPHRIIGLLTQQGNMLGQSRDNVLEIQIRDLLTNELPMEMQLSRWMAVWGAPGL